MHLNIRSVLVCWVYSRLNRWVFNLDLNLMSKIISSMSNMYKIISSMSNMYKIISSLSNMYKIISSI